MFGQAESQLGAIQPTIVITGVNYAKLNSVITLLIISFVVFYTILILTREEAKLCYKSLSAILIYVSLITLLPVVCPLYLDLDTTAKNNLSFRWFITWLIILTTIIPTAAYVIWVSTVNCDWAFKEIMCGTFMCFFIMMVLFPTLNMYFIQHTYVVPYSYWVNFFIYILKYLISWLAILLCMMWFTTVRSTEILYPEERGGCPTLKLEDAIFLVCFSQSSLYPV